MTRIITFTGGSDHSSESRSAAELAARLCAGGRRVCLLALVGSADTAGGLPGWSDITTLADSLCADRDPSLLQHASGCDLVIGGRDARWLRRLTDTELSALGERLQGFGDYDFLLIDAAAGSDQNQLAFALASPEVLLMITPESESLTTAYGLLKLLYAEQYSGSVAVVVSGCENETLARHTYDKLRGIADFYLDMPLPLAGILGTGQTDDGVGTLIDTLLNNPPAETPEPDMATFSRRYLQAAGALPAPDDSTPHTPVFAAAPPDRELRDQLDVLSTQVDDLIAEVGRLRTGATAEPAAVHNAAPARQGPQPPPERCDSACIAAMASGSESVSVAGESFTVYHLRQPGGRQLRFACQSIDDDLEEPEPQSYLS
jgi:flagellar biosynthesis protein FlhG